FKRGNDDQRGDHIREDMAHQDPGAVGADYLGRGDELTLADGQDFAPDDARVVDPTGDHEHQDHVGEARAKRRDDDQCEQDKRDRQKDVDQTHQYSVRPAFVVAGDYAERAAKPAAERYDDRADD